MDHDCAELRQELRGQVSGRRRLSGLTFLSLGPQLQLVLKGMQQEQEPKQQEQEMLGDLWVWGEGRAGKGLPLTPALLLQHARVGAHIRCSGSPVAEGQFLSLYFSAEEGDLASASLMP